MLWSLKEYCATQVPLDTTEWAVASQDFLAALALPSVHPFCTEPLENFMLEGVPPMGNLMDRFEDESALERFITIWYMVAPALLAMAELWLRLFAGAIGPLGCLYLLITSFKSNADVTPSKTQKSKVNWLGVTCLLSVGACLVLMTDTYYVLNNGPIYGLLCFTLAVVLAMVVAYRFSMPKVSVAICLLVLLGVHLIWDRAHGQLQFGNAAEEVHIDEGLYYDKGNPFIRSVVDHWPEAYRTYSVAQGATPWIPTGDARTGLPFLLNHMAPPDWKRVFLPVEDGEYAALDIAFPDDNKRQNLNEEPPVFLILHGLSGGSAEEYIRDFTKRRLAEGSTVVVMVARGLMDLPIKGWNNFHGARTTDAHAAALALRRVLKEDQVLIGVGYSMGGIILSNYVASYGSDCALDGAMSVSGGLDMRFQEHFHRAQRLWQPMLTETLRDTFLLGKWGYRLKARLPKYNMLRTLRASHITEVDRYAVVTYNGFRDLNDYYTSMSALGDIPLGEDGLLATENNGKIHTISIPFCALHALDDPLITWKTTAQNEGFMHPDNLVLTGSGNLMLLLTKGGGHVGWPVGMMPFLDSWRWMNDAAMSFGRAVSLAKATSKKQGDDRQDVKAPEQPAAEDSQSEEEATLGDGDEL